MATNIDLTISRVLSTGAEYKASDLHLTVGNPPILRVDGKLLPLQDEQIITPDFMETFSEAILSAEQKKELKENKELVLAVNMPNKTRYRVNLFFQKGVLAASLRFIPQTIKNIKELGLPQIVEDFAKLTKGLVIVTGPFGSGRTATVASLINNINKTRAVHIMTIEKPIEYIFVNNKSIIEQREVGRDTKSFEQALNTASREDVDVVMVSEMEEKEIIEAVLNTAESSRLVISSMNTDNVLKTIEKIINSFSPQEEEKIRVQLSETLQGIICQRLLPRVGGGRIIVAEVMIFTPPIRTVIRDGALYQLQNIIQTTREEGTISLDRSLAELVKTGEILMDDALAHASDRTNLKMMTRR
jgi:twitching motility protein PilT